jgi:hypothetical protein
VLQNGDLGWYALEYKPTTQSVSTSEQLNIVYSAQLIANVDCAIQIAPFITAGSGNGFANLGIVDTAFQFNSYTLYGGAPQYIYINVPTIGSATIDGGGLWIRSFTSANIQTTGATFLLSKQKR